MTKMIEFRLNTATSVVIAAHLVACDHDFVPPLSTRVEIGGYADKIARRASRFEAWSTGRLVGLVAAYLDDKQDSVAFVTTVSVIGDFHGRGIASMLIDQCIESALKKGFNGVALEVDVGNSAGISLYASKGFAAAGTRGRTVDMVADLRGGTKVIRRP